MITDTDTKIVSGMKAVDLLLIAIDNLWNKTAADTDIDEDTWASLDVLHLRATQLATLIKKQTKPMTDYEIELSVAQVIGMLQAELLES